MIRKQPNPNQPDRCPSIDPLDTLQCGRRIHDDDQCQFGGIAWKKGSPLEMSDRERADRLEAMCDRLAEKADNYLRGVQRVEAAMSLAEAIEPQGSPEWVESGRAMRATVLRAIREALDAHDA